MNDTAQKVRCICGDAAQPAVGPCNSANLAAIVGLPRVSFLIVRSSALSLARRRLLADLCSASLSSEIDSPSTDVRPVYTKFRTPSGAVWLGVGGSGWLGRCRWPTAKAPSTGGHGGLVAARLLAKLASSPHKHYASSYENNSNCVLKKRCQCLGSRTGATLLALRAGSQATGWAWGADSGTAVQAAACWPAAVGRTLRHSNSPSSGQRLPGGMLAHMGGSRFVQKGLDFTTSGRCSPNSKSQPQALP